MKKIMILFGLACLLSLGFLHAADDGSTLGDDAPFLGDVEGAEGKQNASSSYSSDGGPAYDEDEDDDIIEGASYWVEEGFNGIVRQASGTHNTSNVVFFSAAGTLLKTVPLAKNKKHQSQLDPHAARPRVETYKIRYWQGKETPYGLTKWKGRGRYLVCYDKNGHIIESFPWSKKHKTITVSIGKQKVHRLLNSRDPDFPLNLTFATKREGHASADERAVEGKKDCVVQ